MADVTMKRFDDLEGYHGQFLYAGRGVGVTSFGLNVLRLPPHWAEYPEHDHAKDGQEEVYLVIEGSATLQAGAESWILTPGTLARVGPAQKRRLVPGEKGAVIIALGGIPGKAYERPSWQG